MSRLVSFLNMLFVLIISGSIFITNVVHVIEGITSEFSNAFEYVCFRYHAKAIAE